MKKLLEAGLIGKGLTFVESPELVKRYNECLVAIGKEPTTLERFMIDGQGWSPEIAREKSDRMYMSNGEASHFAFILTPEQYRQPHYFPFHSFARPLINAFWENFQAEIADITTTSALILDLNQGLSTYTCPLDLAILGSVTLEACTNDQLLNEAKKQQDLVQHFMSGQNWFDESLRQKLIESAKRFGDLRRRQVLLSPFRFDMVKTFYTMAFGGTYVLRQKGKSGDPLLVFSNEQAAKDFGRPIETAYWAHDPELFDRLAEYNLVSADSKYYETYHFRIPAKIESVFVETLAAFRPEVNPLELSQGQRKRHVSELRGHLPPLFFQLERLQKQMENEKSFDPDNLSPEIRLSLLYPPRSLPQIVGDVVWQLLTEIIDQDIFTVYVYNKPRFLELYQSWPATRQCWAADFLAKNYRAKSQQDGKRTKERK